MEMNIHADAQRIPIRNAIRIYLYMKNPGSTIQVLTNVEFTDLDPTATVDIEGLDVTYETAQEIVDSLWNCGIRPSEGTGSAGSLKATENHLKDMQELSKRVLNMLESSYRGKDDT